MKLTDDTTILLHELYHRREDGRIIVGRPESGEFIVLDPPEFAAVQLLQQRLNLGSIKALLSEQRIRVNVASFVEELQKKGFIHKINNRISTPLQEPIHEVRLSVAWLGGPAARFLYALVALAGLFTLAFFAELPSVYSFFEQPLLSVTFLSIIGIGWLLLLVRQLSKYAAAQQLGIHTRFGFANHYHMLLPRTFSGRMTEQQQRIVLGTGLLSLLASAGVALMLSVFVSRAWYLVFAIAFLELLAECLLFLDTDLAKLIAATMNVHKLNAQTALTMRENWRLLHQGKGSPSHPKITRYAYFYMLSVFLAFVLATVYFVPALLLFVLSALNRFGAAVAAFGANSSVISVLFVDALLALLFVSAELLLFGFALLKHHEKAHNVLFINFSLALIAIGTYCLSFVLLQWFVLVAMPWIVVLLSVLLGILCASIFIAAVRFAYPFAVPHRSLALMLLPILSAAMPLGLVFLVHASTIVYAYALAVGIGMLLAAGFEFHKAS